MSFAQTTPRVLLVEDDEPSRTALKSALEHEGFDVYVACDGNEGIGAVSSFRPDIIVLDLVLPGLNGFDAASLLKGNATTADIPLIAVTASWLGSERTRLNQIGFESALRKPFSISALVHELKKALAG